MDIQIGNDITIQFSIGSLGIDETSIKRMTCWLMNMCACRTACRFPLAPLSHQYIPNEYCVNTCGHPCYHVPPHFGGQYYVFHRHCNCHTHNCCGMTYAPCGNRWHQLGIPRYHALHEPLSIPMGYQCYFPACDQLEVGKYRLIIEVEVFEQGYGRNNIHTYTIDKGIVFTLVCGGSGMSGNISINLLGNEYVGFSTAASANELSFDSLNPMQDLTERMTVNNPAEGNYLWICSTKPITDVTSSGFKVPLEEVEEKEGYYCYRSSNALQATSFDLLIELEEE